MILIKAVAGRPSGAWCAGLVIAALLGLAVRAQRRTDAACSYFAAEGQDIRH